MDLMTGVKVSLKSSPNTWVQPWATKQILYRSIEPDDLNLVL